MAEEIEALRLMLKARIAGRLVVHVINLWQSVDAAGKSKIHWR